MPEKPPEGAPVAPKPQPIPDTKLIEGDDYARATFEEVVFTVTRNGPNLHAALRNGRTPQQGWLVLAPETGGDRAAGEAFVGASKYYAWNTTYFAVTWNDMVFDEWKRVHDEMSGLMGSLMTGRLDLVNVGRLENAENSVRRYTSWLAQNIALIREWIKKLTSDDSEFKGKAAYAIRANLVSIADTMESLYTQIMIERTPSTPDALRRAAETLAHFSFLIPVIWFKYDSLKYWPEWLAQEVLNGIYHYLVHNGLFDLAWLKTLADSQGRGAAEEYIRGVIQNYSSADREGPQSVSHQEVGLETDDNGNLVATTTVTTVEGRGGFTPYKFPAELGLVDKPLRGPLDQPATWDAINNRITEAVLNQMTNLDAFARSLLETLRRVYEDAEVPLANLDDPIITTPGGGGGPGGGPNIPPFKFDPPPPFKFDPPPPFKFDPPPKFEFGPPPDMPDPGGPDLPEIGGPDLPDLRNLGLGDGSGPPNGSGLPGGPFPGGGSPFPGGNPFPSGMPFPGTNLPTGNGRTGPNVPGLVDENGNPIDPDGLRLPGSPDFEPGPGIEVPSPDDIDFPAGGAGPDTDGLPSGGELKLPDTTDGPGGSGAGFPGGGLGDIPGGAPGGAPAMGGAGGEGWADWTGQGGEGQDGDRQNEGFAVPNGGLPMMPPPMMPPMMPGDQKDRERQTWLSEDEKVWGIRNTAGSGVIGLPADIAKEIDEQLAPTHVHVRSVASKAKTDGKQRQKQEATQDEAQQQAST